MGHLTLWAEVAKTCSRDSYNIFSCIGLSLELRLNRIALKLRLLFERMEINFPSSYLILLSQKCAFNSKAMNNEP